MNRPLLWILGGLSLVIIFCHITGIAEKNNVLNPYLGDEKQITGTIDTIPQQKAKGITFSFKIDTINGEHIKSRHLFGTKVQVTLSAYSDAAFPEISSGDQLALCGQLSLADTARNPGSFDYALYLCGKGINGLFYVEKNTDCVLRGKSLHPKYRIDALRAKISETITHTFSPEESDVIQGMLLGEKNISEEIQTLFSDAGISHLLAVSGLHVGYLCLLISWLTAFFKRSARFKLTLLIPTLIFYIILTGSSVSVIRAALMTGLPVLGELFHRHYDPFNGLCLAALIILFLWPAQLFSAGFQMSFGTVAAIIMLYKPLIFSLNRRHLSGKLVESLCLSFCATVGTLPAVLYRFHTLNLVSLISNLLMVPLAGVLMITLLMAVPLMMIFPFAASFFAFFPKLLTQLVIDLSTFFAALPGLKFNGSAPGLLKCLILFAIILALAGYFDLFQKKRRIIFSGCVIGVLTAILVISLWPQPLTITFLDVDQGDAAIIETPNGGAYLVDGGGYEGYRAKEKSQSNPISEKVLLPALYAKGITHLDGVFITHNHSDHAQGIEEILTKMPVDHIYLTTKYSGTALLKQQTIPVTQLCAGMILSTEDGCILQVLWPDSKIEATEDDQQNDASLVFRLIYGRRSFLFTGDAGIETENQLSGILSADLIKIGHHGSAGSTGADFLSKVNPTVAVISVGRYNTYGHPTAGVLEKIAHQNALCYRTDLNGAVVVTTDGKDLEITSYVQ